MTFNAADTQKLLIEYVDKNVHTSFDESHGLLGMVERQDPDATNDIGIRVPVYVEPNSSEGWISESGDYPAADSEVRVNLNVRYKKVFSVGKLTVDTKVHDEQGANAFVKPISASVKACLSSLKKKISGHMYEDGTGKIAVLSAAYSGGAPTVFTCGATRGDFGVQKLTKRKPVQIYDATATTLRNGTIGGTAILTVSSYNKSARTVTFTSNGPSDAVDTDIVVPSGSVNNVVKGLDFITGTTGTYFGQSRATYEGLRGTDKAMSAGSNSASAMDSLSNQMKYKVGVDEVMKTNHIWVMSPEQEQGYKNEGYELRSFPGSDASLSGAGLGFKRGKLSHSDEEFMVDTSCPDSRMYYIDPAVLKLAMLRKVGLFELHAGVMLEPAISTAGTGAYNSDFFYHMGGFFEFFSPEPYRLGRLSGLAIPGSGGNF